MKLLTYYLTLLVSIMFIGCGDEPEDVSIGEAWYANKAFHVVARYADKDRWSTSLFGKVYRRSRIEAEHAINERFNSVISKEETSFWKMSIGYKFARDSDEVFSNMKFTHYLCDSVQVDPSMPSEDGYFIKNVKRNYDEYWATVEYSSPRSEDFESLIDETISMSQKELRKYYSLPQYAAFENMDVVVEFRQDVAGTHLRATLGFLKK